MECVHPWGQMIPSFEVQGKMWGLLFPLILKFTLHCLFLDSFATRMTLVQLCLHVINKYIQTRLLRGCAPTLSSGREGSSEA